LQFPPKPSKHLLSPPYMPHASPISFFLIQSHEWYLVRSTDHKASHYVVLSYPQYLLPLGPKCFPHYPILWHPQRVCLPRCPQCDRPSFTPM
jgi:hypothetical protein